MVRLLEVRSEAPMLNPVRDWDPLPDWAAGILRFVEDAARRGDMVEVVAEAVTFTPAQAARLLDVSRSTVSRLISTGEIASTRMGNRHRIAKPDLESYRARLERQRMNALVALDQAQAAGAASPIRE